MSSVADAVARWSRPRPLWYALLLCVSTWQSAGLAQSIDYTLVTTGRVGDTVPEASVGAALSSADGRFTLFTSSAPNLLADQINLVQAENVFVLDGATGAVTLVSHAFGSATETADGISEAIAISADGNRVLFESSARNLIAGGIYQIPDNHVYLFDRASGQVTLVTHAQGSQVTGANGTSHAVGLSADGTAVLFNTQATNLLSGVSDANGWLYDAYVFDASSGTTTLVSRAGSSASTCGGWGVAISANGRRVLFNSTATTVVPGVTDSNNQSDVFVFERVTTTTVLASHASTSSIVAANAGSSGTALSADGGRVLFRSEASNLVAGQLDMNGSDDVFLFSVPSRAIALVSRALNSPITTPDAAAGDTGLSADGNRVVFMTRASNVVPGVVDSNAQHDIFVYDHVSGTSTLVSSAAGSSGMTTANDESFRPMISADGQWIAFESAATNLVVGVTDANADSDVYLHDRAGASNRLVSRGPVSPLATANGDADLVALSGNGSVVLIDSDADQVIAGIEDHNFAQDLFRFDRATSTNSLVSRSAFPLVPSASGSSRAVDQSDDGRFVLFDSNAADAVRPVARKGGPAERDVYLHDRDTGATVLVSHAAGQPGTVADDFSHGVALSADGRFALFESYATDLVGGQIDNNLGENDVFLYDRLSGESVLVSRALGQATTTGNNRAFAAGISDDGAQILYYSHASNVLAGITDGNLGADAFLFDRVGGTTTLVSHSRESPLRTGDAGLNGPPQLSADGNSVLLSTGASDLVTGLVDANGFYDLFLWNRSNGAIRTVSASASEPGQTGNGPTWGGRLSADGSRVAFESQATNLVAGVVDSNGASSDVFVFDAASGNTALVSRAAGTATTTANLMSLIAAISADGSRIAYISYATNVVTGVNDSNQETDVFLFDIASGASQLVSLAIQSPLQAANAASNAFALSADGKLLLFSTRATNLLPGAIDDNDVPDVYRFDGATGRNLLVSRSYGIPGITASDALIPRAFSADGQRVLLDGIATDVVIDSYDGNGRPDVFVAQIEAVLFADGFE